MTNRYSYTYCVLRYVHDTTSNEFVNVGVVLYAPKAKYLSALCRTTTARSSGRPLAAAARTTPPELWSDCSTAWSSDTKSGRR